MFLDWLSHGLLALPWWGVLLAGLVLTHFTIASVTIYLHRCQAHRGLDLHPLISHPMRFWLWLTTGMVTKEWVAIHRKHHAKVETPEDPHSPQVLGIGKVMREGSELYRAEAKNSETLEKYGHGTPNDWLERHLYSPHNILGVSLLLITDILLFGVLGLTLWAVQMIWIPFWAAGVINGLGHYRGYRNFETRDGSTNISNIGILIGGEELHNNHHAFPSSARFSLKPWEFDIGWFYIRLLAMFRLAKIKRVAPLPVVIPGKDSIDMDTVRAVIAARMQVLANYARYVLVPVMKEELPARDAAGRRMLKQVKAALVRNEARITEAMRMRLQEALDNDALRTVYQFRDRLTAVWEQTYASQEQLRKALQDWCQQAEATGIEYLQQFARKLRGYSLEAASI
jgi:stearoyl-CoA desaturase (delta-9 desaturase)